MAGLVPARRVPHSTVNSPSAPPTRWTSTVASPGLSTLKLGEVKLKWPGAKFPSTMVTVAMVGRPSGLVALRTPVGDALVKNTLNVLVDCKVDALRMGIVKVATSSLAEPEKLSVLFCARVTPV